MTRPTITNRGGECGFFTIWVLGLCVMVLSIGGISFDFWHAFSDKRELSSIVDGAAVAAASQIDLAAFRNNSETVQLNTTAARTAAQTYLDRAEVETGLTLTDESIRFEDNNVVVTASTTTNLTLTQLLAENATLTSTVSGAANPRPA